MEREKTPGDGRPSIVVKADPDLSDIIPGYLENRRNDVVLVKEAIARGDYGRIKVIGHQMRGSGTGYGFEALTDIGTLLEKAANDEDAAGVSSALASLADYLERLDVIYY